MKISLALAQINTQLGNIDANLEKHLAYIQRAQQADADIIVFPELSLTGYMLQDLAAESISKPNADDPAFGPLLEASKKIDIIVGFVDADARHTRYIAAAYLSEGQVLHIHRKIYLPTYGLFEDLRYFKAGNNIRAFDTRFGRMGMLICEDFWHASPPYVLYADGAELQIYISASPSRGLTDKPEMESARWVNHIAAAYASLYTSFIANTNRVGFEDGLNYWGGASVYDPNGDLVAAGPQHEEALTFAKIDMNQIRRTRARLPMLGDERPELIKRELERILGERDES